MKSPFKVFVTSALLLGSAAAGAAGFGFLAETPMGKFNEDDLKLMNGAIDKALAASEMGTRIRWGNDRTGSSGEVTPQRAFASKGRPCRDLKVLNRHKSLEASGVYTLCREDGGWKLAQ